MDLRTESWYAYPQIIDRFEDRRLLRSQRFGHEFSENLRKGPTGHTPQDVDDEHVPDVGVRPTVSRREKHSVRQDGVKKLLPCPRSPWVAPHGLMIFR